MEVFKIKINYPLVLLCLFLCSCGQNNENQIQNLKYQVSSLNEENEKLKNEIEDYKLQLDKLESETFNSTNNRDLQSATTNRVSEWQFVESTNLQTADGDNVISGTISEGYVFKSLSGNFYRANSLTLQVVVAVMPNAEIYRNRNKYKLIIEDFDEPVFCDKVIRR